MQVIADLQLHSKYSRAVSKDMVIPVMAAWGRRKGIDLLATGDWTHSLWMVELQANLEEVSEGIFRSKADPSGAKFLLSTEISSIYTQGGRVRRVHTLIFAPNFSVARKINGELLKRGCNLSSDGRPIVGLSCKQLAEIVLAVDEKCLLIPAHCWTPHFALYGPRSGFDSIEECFGEFSNQIFAVESGLSSDPAMNWRIKELERRAIVSFSDAHSPMKLGREATVFTGDHNFTYNDIYGAIAERFTGKNEGRLKIDYTIEFYPEEGKYHYTGHRNCGVKGSPGLCPKCGRPLTVGVMDRVEQLAQGGIIEPIKKLDKNGVVVNYHPTDETRPPYVMMVPLAEILAQVYEVGVGSKQVQSEYERLIGQLKGEFQVLLATSIEKLIGLGGEKLAEAVDRVRRQDISIDPGYDGEYGKVEIWGESSQLSVNSEQMGLF
jgi:uncharacterized protein (TIGR00375 family)